MLPSLELIVNPKISKVYKRLLTIVYLLSILFIINSSFYLVIKFLLLSFLLLQFNVSYKEGKPHPELYEMKHSGKEWSLITQNGEESLYDTVTILIHNPLFQLIRLSQLNKNKLIILFNDQLSKQQLRLLHLKTAKN